MFVSGHQEDGRRQTRVVHTVLTVPGGVRVDRPNPEMNPLQICQLRCVIGAEILPENKKNRERCPARPSESLTVSES